MVAGSTLTPALWLYGPDGRLLDSFVGNGAAAEVSFRATNSGTFMVVASDLSGGYAGSGTYRLTLAKTGGPIVVSPGDEGGPFTGVTAQDGTLSVGDLDVFYFTACSGDNMVLQLEELVSGSSLTPSLRLYGRDGILLKSASGIATAQMIFRATNGGTFMVVAGDLSGGFAGSGTYRLTVNGLSAGLKLCVPLISGTNVTLGGVGGAAGSSFILFTSTNIDTPPAQWTPLQTNQFDPFGVFSLTNRFNRTEPQRFYLLRLQ
jgi:hypothetical protein